MALDIATMKSIITDQLKLSLKGIWSDELYNTIDFEGIVNISSQPNSEAAIDRFSAEERNIFTVGYQLGITNQIESTLTTWLINIMNEEDDKDNNVIIPKTPNSGETWDLFVTRYVKARIKKAGDSYDWDTQVSPALKRIINGFKNGNYNWFSHPDDMATFQNQLDSGGIDWEVFASQFYASINSNTIDPNWKPEKYIEAGLEKSEEDWRVIIKSLNNHIESVLEVTYHAPYLQAYKDKVSEFVAALKIGDFDSISAAPNATKLSFKDSDSSFVDGGLIADCHSYCDIKYEDLKEYADEHTIQVLLKQLRKAYYKWLGDQPIGSDGWICSTTNKGCNGVARYWIGEKRKEYETDGNYSKALDLIEIEIASGKDDLFDDVQDFHREGAFNPYREGGFNPLDNGLTEMFADIIKFAAISAVLIVGGYIGYTLFLSPYLKKRAIKSEIKDQIEGDRMRMEAGLPVSTGSVPGTIPVTPMQPMSAPVTPIPQEKPSIRARTVDFLPPPAAIAVKTIKGDDL